MLTALYANTNYDGEENHAKREQALEGIEERFTKAVRNLYRSEAQIKAEAEEENLEKDPFFKPMYKNLRDKGILEGKPKNEFEIDQE